MTTSSPTPVSPSSPRRRLLLAAAGAVAVVALLAAARAAQARHELVRARHHLGEARLALAHNDAAASRRLLDRADARLAGARRAAERFPLSLVRPLPVVGSPARAMAGAAGAGRHAVAAGRVMADAAAAFPTSGTTGVDGHDLSDLHAAAGRSVAALDRAAASLRRARAELRGPAGAALPFVSGPARSLRRSVDEGLGQLAGARRGLTLAAGLTAPGADARILVLAQDTMELRPTGGYIGSFGVLRFSGGTVALERYQSFEELPPPDPPMEAPPELAAFAGGGWSLENVGWWPHFPTSAAAAKEMFRRQGGGEVDAVVAITEHVLAELVEVFGPVPVPGYAKPVTGEGFAKRVLYEVELKRPLDVPRKRFLTLLATEVLDRLFSLPAADVPAVVKALARAGAAGDVQVWFADAARQRLVGGTTWAGELPAPERDFLMLVDANLTASKANADLVREATYRVRRDGDGRLVARLNVRYRNEGQKSPINPYYNGRLRVYVPAGARLLGADGTVWDEGIADDGPYRVFARDVYVMPRGEQVVTFDYLLPDSVAPQSSYRLRWVRQAGTPADSLTAVVGGATWRADAGERSLDVDRPLRRNRVAEFVRSRRFLGELLD